MDEQFSRLQMLVGQSAMDRLRNSRVAVFGIGGVGGHCTEALARSGVGTLDLFDDDCVSVSNLNRQIIALHSTVGQPKVNVMCARILDISPGTTVHAHQMFYTPQNAANVDLTQYDYIVDAIDTVTSKLELICRAKTLGVPVISSMGTANKLDPSALRLMDLSETSGCPLARIMRKELRKRGIIHLQVVSSLEAPVPPSENISAQKGDSEIVHRPGIRADRPIPGSTAFVPAAAGLILASAVVRSLIKENTLF